MEHKNDTNPMDKQSGHMPGEGAPGTRAVQETTGTAPGIRTGQETARHSRRMKRGEVRPGSAWALVTGAGSGIGRCYALRLAALGYRLVIVGNNAAPLEAVAGEIRRAAGANASASFPEVRVMPMDLARVGAAQELHDRTAAEGIEIDVVINNAGIFSFCDILTTPDNCARRGLRALWRGRRCIVPDWWNRAWIPLCKALPMWVLRPIRRFTMRFQK